MTGNELKKSQLSNDCACSGAHNEFRIPDSSFLDSGIQTIVDSGFQTIVDSGFQTIVDSGFQQQNLLDSGFSYMGRIPADVLTRIWSFPVTRLVFRSGPSCSKQEGPSHPSFVARLEASAPFYLPLKVWVFHPSQRSSQKPFYRQSNYSSWWLVFVVVAYFEQFSSFLGENKQQQQQQTREWLRRHPGVRLIHSLFRSLS